MKRMSRAAGAALAFACLSIGPAAAQSYREEPVSRIGSGTILRIIDNNQFNRCAASFGPNASMLRIAFNKDRLYQISVPAAPTARPPIQLAIQLNPGGRRVINGTQNHARAAGNLDSATTNAILEHRGPFVVGLGGNRYEWNLGAPMPAIFEALENCTNRASGWR